jgi:hypothetical protein
MGADPPGAHFFAMRNFSPEAQMHFSLQAQVADFFQIASRAKKTRV